MSVERVIVRGKFYGYRARVVGRICKTREEAEQEYLKMGGVISGNTRKIVKLVEGELSEQVDIKKLVDEVRRIDPNFNWGS